MLYSKNKTKTNKPKPDAHLWRSLLGVVAHPCLWCLPLGRRPAGQDWFHAVGKFQLICSQDPRCIGLCSFQEFSFICGGKVNVDGGCIENTKNNDEACHLPSGLKWRERPGDGDFDRLLWLLGDLETLRLCLLTIRLFLRLLW